MPSQEKELGILNICTFKCHQPFPLIYYIKLLREEKTGFTCIHIKNISATNFFGPLKIWLSSLSLFPYALSEICVISLCIGFDVYTLIFHYNSVVFPHQLVIYFNFIWKELQH